MRNGRLFAVAFLMVWLTGYFGMAPVFASKNLLPRMPELVIERGFSDAFQVTECEASTQLVNDESESQLRVVLKNITDKTIETAIKVRILYLLSDHSAQILVNGKHRSFERKNPRIPFTLGPGEMVDLQIKAKQTIQYNLDMIKKETNGTLLNGSEEKTPKKKFELNDLTSLFGKENFGRRFMVGPLVSKWGIFPVDFKQVHLTVTVPADFVGVFPTAGVWQKKEKNSSVVYSFEGTEGFTGALFLPKKDAESLPPVEKLQGTDVSSTTIEVAPPGK